MGSMIRKADNTYQLRFEAGLDLNNKRIQKSVVFYGNKKAAKAELDRLEDLVSRGQYITENDSVKTFGDLVDLFMERKKTWYPAKTFQEMESRVKLRLKPQLGQLELRKMTKGHLLDAYRIWQMTRLDRNSKKSTISSKSLRELHSMVKLILTRGVKWQLVHFNVADQIDNDELPRLDAREMRTLNEAELIALLGHLGTVPKRSIKRNYLSAQPWFAVAIIFAAYTGARRGEILGMKWADVDYQSRSLTIRRSISETNSKLVEKEMVGRRHFEKSTKENRWKTIGLQDSMTALLQQHRLIQDQERAVLGDLYKDSDYIFAMEDGRVCRPWNFGRAFEEFADRAGFPDLSMHCLRHTNASIMMRDPTITSVVVAARLGHSDDRFTKKRYVHTALSDDLRAANSWEDRVGPATSYAPVQKPLENVS